MEELQRMTEAPLTRCPRCKKNTLQRLIGSGSGIIFKGSGFYETDYKKKARKSETPKETKTSVSTSSKQASKKEHKDKKK
jgi:putative FmdB family regulatory protein